MKNLMREAAAEIHGLRRQNEILRAKVDTMELFAMVLKTQPAAQTQVYSFDVAHALEKAAQDIEDKEKQSRSGGCC